MKKTFLKAAVLAVALSLPSMAMAVVTTVVDLDAATGASAFATEIGLTDANPLAVAGGAANALNFSAKIGFGVSNGQTRYIRIQYGNATLDAAHGATLGTDLEDATTATALDAGGGSMAKVQGGAAGDTYVIYQITAGADIASADIIDVKVPALRVTSNSSPVTVSMQLHETAVSAVAGASGAGLLYSKDGSIATFSPGMNFALTPGANTAAVTTLFTLFCDSAADCTAANADLIKPLGTLVYDKTAVLERDGSAIEFADVVTTANLIVTGDFSSAEAADSLYLDTNGGACPAAPGDGAFTLNADKTQGTAAVNATALAAGTNVCFESNGTAPIAVQTINAALDILTTPTDVTTPDVGASSLGTIAHDGTVLKAPYFENKTGQATYVNLSNSSTTAADYTVSCLNASADPTVGTPGTVDASRTTKLNMTALGCPSNTRSVELTLAVPLGSVTGEVVRSQTTTGNTGIDGMVGNQ